MARKALSRRAMGLGARAGLGRRSKGHASSPTSVNLGILGGGIVMGLLAYPHRETALGTVVLGAAGSIAGVALVFFLNEVFFPRSAPA